MTQQPPSNPPGGGQPPEWPSAPPPGPPPPGSPPAGVLDGAVPPGAGPRRRGSRQPGRAPLLVGLVVLALIVVGAFVLLGQGDGGGGASGGGGGAGGDGPDVGGGGGEAASESIEEFGQRLAEAIDQRAADELRAMSCDDAGQTVQLAIDGVDLMDGAELVGTEESGVDGFDHIVTLDLVLDDVTHRQELMVVEQGNGFCWQEMTPRDQQVVSIPSAEEVQAHAAQFLEAINSGDADAAAAMLCSDSVGSVGQLIDDAVAADADLQIDPATVEASEGNFSADLTGTVNGEPLRGETTLIATYEGQHPCVNWFAVDTSTD